MHSNANYPPPPQPPPFVNPGLALKFPTETNYQSQPQIQNPHPFPHSRSAENLKGFSNHNIPQSTSKRLGNPGYNQSASKINPGQLPHPDKPQVDLIYTTRSASSRRNPPTVNSLFTAVDNGNCNPRFLRCSLVAPPTHQPLLHSIGIPLAIHATPFAKLSEEEERIPLIPYDYPIENSQSSTVSSLFSSILNFGSTSRHETDVSSTVDSVIVRCTKCEAYINPFVSWLDQGHKWQCNLCSQINLTSEAYYAPLDAAGLRSDRLLRPELMKGSYEFELPKELFESEKSVVDHRSRFVFMIDVSPEAVRQGFSLAAIRSIQRIIDTMNEEIDHKSSLHSKTNNDNNMHHFPPPFAQHPYHPHKMSSESFDLKYNDFLIAIFTYNHSLQFYSIYQHSQSQEDDVHCLVVDADDAMCPLPDSKFFHSVSQQKESVYLILRKITSLLNVYATSTYCTLQGTTRYPQCPDYPDIASLSALTAVANFASNYNLCRKIDNLSFAQRFYCYLFTSYHATCGRAAIPFPVLEKSLTAYGNNDEIFLYAPPISLSTANSTLSPATSSSNNAGTVVNDSNLHDRNLSPKILENSLLMRKRINLTQTLLNWAGSSSPASSSTNTKGCNKQGFFKGLPVTIEEDYSQVQQLCIEQGLVVNVVLSTPEIASLMAFPKLNTTNISTSTWLLLYSRFYGDLAHISGGKLFTISTTPNQSLSSNILSSSEHDEFQSQMNYIYNEEKVAYLESLLLQHINYSIVRSSITCTTKLRYHHLLQCEEFISCGKFEDLKEIWTVNGMDTSVTAMYTFSLTSNQTNQSNLPSAKAKNMLVDDDKLYFQLATFYFHSSNATASSISSRIGYRVRVHNLSVICSDKASVVYRNCDMEAIVATLMKQSLYRLYHTPLYLQSYPALDSQINNKSKESEVFLGDPDLQNPRDYMQSMLVHILSSYRLLCSLQSPRQQLILPEALKLLPMYTLATLKHPVFLENPVSGIMHVQQSYSSQMSGNNTPNTPKVLQSMYVSTASNRHPANLNSSNKSYPMVSYLQNSLNSGPSSMYFIHNVERNFESKKLLHSDIYETINSIYPRCVNLFAVLDEELALLNSSLSVSTEDQNILSCNSISESKTVLNLNTSTNLPVDTLAQQTSHFMLINQNTQRLNTYSENIPNISIIQPSPPPSNFSATPIPNNPFSNRDEVVKNPINNESYLRTQRQKLLALNTLPLSYLPSSAGTYSELEGDQVYLFEDRTFLYVIIGRTVSIDLIEDLFNCHSAHNHNNSIIYERLSEMTLRRDTILAQKVKVYIELIRQNAAYRLGKR
jgi:hypothetical protein